MSKPGISLHHRIFTGDASHPYWLAGSSFQHTCTPKSCNIQLHHTYSTDLHHSFGTHTPDAQQADSTRGMCIASTACRNGCSARIKARAAVMGSVCAAVKAVNTIGSSSEGDDEMYRTCGLTYGFTRVQCWTSAVLVPDPLPHACTTARS